MSLSEQIQGIVHAFSDAERKDSVRRIASEVATLERENAAMREAIGEADGALRKCLNYMLRLPLSGSDAECEAMDDAHHALSKLQPFLKP